MSSNHQRWDWVQRYADGLATGEEVARLQAALQEDATFRAQFLEYLHLDAALSETLGAAVSSETEERIVPLPTTQSPASLWRRWIPLAAAACLLLSAAGVWSLWFRQPGTRVEATGTAIAMLTRAVDARWSQGADPLRKGTALKPGWLRLESGLAQVVFYSGARIVMEGPAELQLVSPAEAVCPRGRLLAEVPGPARGFRLKTDDLNVVDLGTEFGIDATRSRTEVHVFKGQVEITSATAVRQSLVEGQAAVARGSTAPRLMVANAAAFAPLFELQQRSLASEAIRYDEWRVASAQLNQDPSLVVHLDFQDLNGLEWTLRNTAESNPSVRDATIVGGQRVEGRWRGKQALEFQGVNDRVRLAVPGEFKALTLSAWVRITGLDRQFNSLFMCDGFDAGKVHWQIRSDGILDLGVQGAHRRDVQIIASPPVIGFSQFGQWVHLAVVLDGARRQVVHYVNGAPVSRHTLKREPPFRIGEAELGNWNPGEIPNKPPALIRHFSGAMDEFALFGRALSAAEIQQLYMAGRPQTEPAPIATARSGRKN